MSNMKLYNYIHMLDVLLCMSHQASRSNTEADPVAKLVFRKV